MRSVISQPASRWPFTCRVVMVVATLTPLFCSTNCLAQEIKSIKVDSPITALAVTPDQKILASTGNVLLVLDKDLNYQKKVPTELDQICSIKLKEKLIYLAGGSPAEHGMIEVRKLGDGAMVKRKVVHRDVIHSMDLTDSELVTCSFDTTASVLDATNLKVKRMYKEHSQPTTAVASLPDSEWALSAGLDDTIRIWSRKTGQTKRVLSHHQGDVVGLAVEGVLERGAPKRLVRAVSISADRTVRFWQPIIGRLVRFKQVEQTPSACCWIPGSDRVLVGFDNGFVLTISAQDLTFNLIAGGRGRIYSLAVFDSSTAIVGTSTELFILKLPK